MSEVPLYADSDQSNGLVLGSRDFGGPQKSPEVQDGPASGLEARNLHVCLTCPIVLVGGAWYHVVGCASEPLSSD